MYIENMSLCVEPMVSKDMMTHPSPILVMMLVLDTPAPCDDNRPSHQEAKSVQPRESGENGHDAE